MYEAMICLWVLSYLQGKYLEAPPPILPEHVRNNPHAS